MRNCSTVACITLALCFSAACSDDAADGPNTATTPTTGVPTGGAAPAGGGMPSVPPPMGGQAAGGGSGGTPAGGGAMNGGGGGMPGGGTMNGGGGGMANGGMGGEAEPANPGKALYEANCSVCHGDDAKGKADPGGKLLGTDARHPDQEYTEWLIRMGSSPRNTNETYVAPMLPISEADLPDADMQLILDYLNDREVFPQETTGEALYADYCSACHAADGGGEPTGRPLGNVMRAGISGDVRNGHHAGEYTNTREFMPKFSTEQISDAELELIIEHVDAF